MTVDAPRVVGRSREDALLAGAVARIADGAVCIEVVGEAGIGKTTMLGRLADLASPRGSLVLGGHGSEFERDLDFGLFVDALDAHLGNIDDRWARNLAPDVLTELAAIFPSLRSRGRDERPPASAYERFRAHRAVRELLERLAATRPLVLVLDDVHWADSASMELIGSLLRRPPAARLLIALAYRAYQAPDRLSRELAAAVGDGVLERIELGPLSRADADALLSEGAAGRRDHAQIFRESGGNPFYLHQLARTAGRAHVDGGLGAGVPQAVAASLGAELRMVSPFARLLARASSVAGDPFDLDLAAQIAELERPMALAGLDELVAAEIVRSDGGPLGFAFRHPLVRRAIYESVRPGWRIAAHARASSALARRGAPAAARAHHVERCAEVGDAVAIGLLVSAAEGTSVPRAAAHWLGAAVRLAPVEGRQRLELLCRLGETLAAAGLMEEAREALVEALERWPVDGDCEGRIGLVVVCALVERLLGRHEQAHARLAAAAGELDDPDCAAGVALSIEVAIESVMSTDYPGVRVSADVALRSATVLGDPLLRAAATTMASFGDYCVSDVDRARLRIVQAGAIVAGLADDVVATRPDVLFWLGWTARFVDRYELAVGHFERGLRVARASGRSQLFVELTAARAHALSIWGRLAESRCGCAEAIEAARLSENPQPLAWALGFSSFAQMDSGNLDAAVREAREAVALAVDGSVLSMTCWAALAMALIEAGESAEAIEIMVRAAGGPELALVNPLTRPLFYEGLTRAELGLGRIENAAGWARRAGAIVDGVSCDLPRALADRAAAIVLLARGEVATAAEMALASAVRADGVEARVEAGRSRLVAGRALAAAGRREAAVQQLRTAEAALTRCGAWGVRQACVRELRRVGVRVARAGARGDGAAIGLASLSGREREVAEYVRARHTNREIAKLLFLSEKTIESHLRSVFVKLGVTSRADVARAMDDAEGRDRSGT